MSEYPKRITIKSDDNILEIDEVITTKDKQGLMKVTAVKYRYTKSVTKLDKTLTMSVDEIGLMGSKQTAIFNYE